VRRRALHLGGPAIKGPSGRLKHDVRRVWECPACGRREHTGGEVVTRLCACQSEADPPRTIWMRLLEQPPQSEGARARRIEPEPPAEEPSP
jgi:hypothetical protein